MAKRLFNKKEIKILDEIWNKNLVNLTDEQKVVRKKMENFINIKFIKLAKKALKRDYNL